jgi:hypothetical protein
MESATIIATTAIAGCCWIAFGIWEHYLAQTSKAIVPIFPIHLVKNRVVAAALGSVL